MPTTDIGQQRQNTKPNSTDSKAELDNFVLDKGIFSNIFEKDIRRVYLYKKSERLAKALHLIAPAFKNTHALRNRIEKISVELVDASILPPFEARDALSRELLALSSVLSIARTAGLLSSMNTDLIAKEAHMLLRELASYEEPKLSFDETPTLAALAKRSSVARSARPELKRPPTLRQAASQGHDKGQTQGIKDRNGRADAILSVLRSKGPSYIKDISTVIREVSEKTIQRELQSLVNDGIVAKEGERRWTTYTLVRENANAA